MTKNGCKMCKTIVTADLGESVFFFNKQARVQFTRALSGQSYSEY